MNPEHFQGAEKKKKGRQGQLLKSVCKINPKGFPFTNSFFPSGWFTKSMLEELMTWYFGQVK